MHVPKLQTVFGPQQKGPDDDPHLPPTAAHEGAGVTFGGPHRPFWQVNPGLHPPPFGQHDSSSPPHKHRGGVPGTHV